MPAQRHHVLMGCWRWFTWLPGTLFMLGMQLLTIAPTKPYCSAPSLVAPGGVIRLSRFALAAQISPLAVMGWLTGGLSCWACCHWRRFVLPHALHQWTVVSFVAVELIGFWFCTIMLFRCSAEMSEWKEVSRNLLWFHTGCLFLERVARFRCIVLRMKMLHQKMGWLLALCMLAFCVTSAASSAVLAIIVGGKHDLREPAKVVVLASFAFGIPSIMIPVFRLFKAAAEAADEEHQAEAATDGKCRGLREMKTSSWLRSTAWCIGASLGPTMVHTAWMQWFLWPEAQDAFPLMSPEYLSFVASLIHLVDVAAHLLVAIVLAELWGPAHITPLCRLHAASSLIAAAKEREIQTMLGEHRQASASTVAALLGDLSPTEVMSMAKERFRCVPLDQLTYDIFASGGAYQQSDKSAPSSQCHLSVPVELGRCDVFVSHSWHDEPQAKWDALMDWCEEFKQRHGRSPMLWLDKVCIDQSNIEADLRCLPVFLASCRTLLVLAGSTYLTRLWCALELYVYVELHGSLKASRSITRIPSKPEQNPISIVSLQEYGREMSDVASLKPFDAASCQCFNAADKARILEVISRRYPGGVTAFNQAVDELLVSEQQFGTRKGRSGIRSQRDSVTSNSDPMEALDHFPPSKISL